MSIVNLISLAIVGILGFAILLIIFTTGIVYLMWRYRRIIIPEIILGLMNTLDYPIKRIFWFFKLDTQAVDLVKTLVINKIYEEEFAKVPPERRLIILPQCLRHVNCPSRLDPEQGIVCLKCGLCGIKEIIEEAERLGEKVVIVPGGTFAVRMLKKFKPKGVIGVACPAEIREGADAAIKYKIIPQTVPLLRSGCVNTLVDWDEVKRVMRLGLESKAEDMESTKMETVTENVEGGKETA